MAIENIIEGILRTLPSEISSKIDLVIILIQTLGGLLFVYLILMVIRIIMVRKQNKLMNEIKRDVKYLRNELKLKKTKKVKKK